MELRQLRYSVAIVAHDSLSRAARVLQPALTQHGVRPRIENAMRSIGATLTAVIEINSIAILKSAMMADMGATILPVAPLLDEIERGAMRAYPITQPGISRAVVLCASKNIPLTNAAGAMAHLILDETAKLCASGRWLGARSLIAQPGQVPAR